MKISLRKAAALQAELRKLIVDSVVPSQIVVTEFATHFEDKILSAREEAIKVIAQRQTLNTALFEIRQGVAVANAETGISIALGQLAHAESVVRDLQSLKSLSAQSSLEEIEKRLEKMRNTPETQSRGYLFREDSGIAVSVLTQEDLNQYATQLNKAKRTVRDLKDRLLELNTSNQIQLTDTTVAQLKVYDLI